jgi:hypothetical protein
MHSHSGSFLALLAFIFGVSTANAAIVYSEGTSGDLSNVGLTPTAITVLPGSNQILGDTGRPTAAAAIDRDYFRITIPVGFGLFGITVLPGTTSGGVAFIGIQAGPQLTLPTNPPSAAGLLGWWHYSAADIGTDILEDMAIPANGSLGFDVPLATGTYAFWVQDFNVGLFPYAFDLSVSRVPEPGSALLVAIGVGAAVIARRRRSKFMNSSLG